MKEILIDNFAIMCRLCLRERTVKAINEIKHRTVLLSNLLATYVSFKMEEDDKKPKKICKICEKKIFAAHNFIENCKKSDTILNEVLFKQKNRFTETCDTTDEIPLIEFIKQEEPVSEIILKQPKVEVNSNSASLNIEEPVPDTFLKKEVTEIEKVVEIELSDNDTIDIENDLYLSEHEEEKLSKSIVKPYVTKVQSKKTYTCTVCNEVFNDHESVLKHKKEFKHLRPNKFTCSTCNKSFDSNYRLKEHIRTHTGERPHVCETCNKRFNGKSDLKRHVLIVHLNIKRYKCQHCGKSFTRKFYLINHERIHTGEKFFTSCCGKEYTSYYALHVHEKKHKYNQKYVKRATSNKPKKSNEGTHPCNSCGKVFGNEPALKRHTSVKHDLRNLTCDDCGGTFTNRKELHEHIRSTHKSHPYTISHAIKKFNCEICSKDFKYRSSLRDHMRTHTGDTTFRCLECDKICINKRRFQEHLTLHTGEKPYACNLCGKTFRSRTRISDHMKTHTGVRNHACSKCGKSFYDARTLNKHFLKHEGEVP